MSNTRITVAEVRGVCAKVQELEYIVVPILGRARIRRLILDYNSKNKKDRALHFEKYEGNILGRIILNGHFVDAGTDQALRLAQIAEQIHQEAERLQKTITKKVTPDNQHNIENIAVSYLGLRHYSDMIGKDSSTIRNANAMLLLAHMANCSELEISKMTRQEISLGLKKAAAKLYGKAAGLLGKHRGGARRLRAISKSLAVKQDGVLTPAQMVGKLSTELNCSETKRERKADERYCIILSSLTEILTAPEHPASAKAQLHRHGALVCS